MLPLLQVSGQCLNFPGTCLDEHLPLCSQDRMRLRGSNINKTYSGCVCGGAVPGLCWRTRTGGWWTPRWPGDLLLTVSHMLPLVTSVRSAAISWLLVVSSPPPGAARDLPAGGWAGRRGSYFHVPPTTTDAQYDCYYAELCIQQSTIYRN